MVHGLHGQHGAPALIPVVEEHRPSTGGALVKLLGENHALGWTKNSNSATKMLVTKVIFMFWWRFLFGCFYTQYKCSLMSKVLFGIDYIELGELWIYIPGLQLLKFEVIITSASFTFDHLVQIWKGPVDHVPPRIINYKCLIWKVVM